MRDFRPVFAAISNLLRMTDLTFTCSKNGMGGGEGEGSCGKGGGGAVCRGCIEGRAVGGEGGAVDRKWEGSE